MRRSCGRPRLRFWSARYEQIRRRGLPVQQSATACDVCARPRTAQGGSFEGLLSIAYAMDFFWIFGAARSWRQADMMRADGGEVRQRTVCRRRQRRAGRPARGERESAAGAGDGRVRPAAAAPGETLEGAVSARTRRGGGRAIYTAAAGSPRGGWWCPPSRAGSSPAGSPRYAAAAKAAARAAFFIGVFPARELVRVRPAAPSKEISMRAI